MAPRGKKKEVSAPAAAPKKRRGKSKLPPIPEELHTAIGPISVVWETGLMEKEHCVGKFEWRERTITLDDKLSLHSAWVTLEHELVHAILLDAGIVNFPDRNEEGSELEERICDSIAAARIAEMQRRSA